MTEKVLVFPAQIIDGYQEDFQGGILTKPARVQDYLDSIFGSNELFYLERDRAEQDPDFKQLIPYVVLKGKNGVFSYRRTKKSGENRLHGLWSVGVGGHLNLCDDDSGCDDWGLYLNGFRRELREEVGLDVGEVPSPCALIYDDSNLVGQVHFGVIHVLPVSTGLECNDPALAEGNFCLWPYLASIQSEFEHWSKLLLSDATIGAIIETA